LKDQNAVVVVRRDGMTRRPELDIPPILDVRPDGILCGVDLSLFDRVPKRPGVDRNRLFRSPLDAK
jgi:hypothetical protein